VRWGCGLFALEQRLNPFPRTYFAGSIFVPAPAPRCVKRGWSLGRAHPRFLILRCSALITTAQAPLRPSSSPWSSPISYAARLRSLLYRLLTSCCVCVLVCSHSLCKHQRTRRVLHWVLTTASLPSRALFSTASQSLTLFPLLWFPLTVKDHGRWKTRAGCLLAARWRSKRRWGRAIKQTFADHITNQKPRLLSPFDVQQQLCNALFPAFYANACCLAPLFFGHRLANSSCNALTRSKRAFIVGLAQGVSASRARPGYLPVPASVWWSCSSGSTALPVPRQLAFVDAPRG